VNWREELTKVGAQTGILGRFAGPVAFRQAVVLPMLLLLLFNGTVSGVLDTTAAVVGPAVGLGLATLVAWTVFTVAGFIVDRTLAVPSLWRRLSVALVYALTEVARIETIRVLAGGEAFGPEIGGLYRVSAAATTGLVILGLTSVAVEDYITYRNSYRAYSTRVDRLAIALEETRSHVELVRAQFATWVRRLLTDNVSKAFTIGSPQDPRHLEIANELFRISDEIVRPLSHGLSENPPTPPDFLGNKRPPRVSFRAFLRDGLLVAPFQPVVASVILAIVTAPNILLGSPLAGVGVWLLLVGMVFGVGIVGRAALAPQLKRLPPWLGLILAATLSAAPFPLYGWLLAGEAFSPGVPLAGFLVYISVVGAILVSLPALADGLRYSRGRFITELAQVDEQLAWSQTRAQSQLWLDQRRLALTLHSDVQSTILASAMQLKNAVVAGPEQAKAVLPTVERTIRKSLLLSFDDSKIPALSSVVTQINKTWASLTTLALEAPKGVMAAIGNDPLALEVAAEAIKELHMNSFKHGRATECVITLSLVGERAVRIVMRNNGAPLTERASAGFGLGNSFFSAVSLSQAAKNVLGGVEVALEIPLELRTPAKKG
jgi:signal transduction histidine kinase